MLPKLSLGYSELRDTEIKNSTGTPVMVSAGETIELVPSNLIDKSFHIPLQRLHKKCGPGPFTLKRIVQFPTQSICLEFIDQYGTLQTINKGYFSKSTL